MNPPAYLSSIAGSSPLWLRDAGQAGVVVSSRIRLARNLAGRMFPDRMEVAERIALWQEMGALLADQPLLGDSVLLDMGDLPELSRQLIFERHLISREQLSRGPGSGVATRRDELLSVMLNEEDHFRIQSFQPGLNLMRAWERIDALDSAISENVEYAFSERFGYLTCCPTNLGTGMRASVMLHLPALSLLDEIRPVVNGLAKIGLMVRGMWGEGSEIAGHMYQVSNQITLGKQEVEIINHLGHIVGELIEHEENARQRLIGRHRSLIEDYVWRARGVLEYAHILSSKEAFEMLSALRLGLEVDLIDNIEKACIDELFLMIQPAHLQLVAEQQLDSRERDELRARTVREFIETGHKGSGNDDE